MSLQKRATGLKRASMGKSKRQATYASLKKRLDAIHSIYVRRSNADRNGNVSCYTCDVVLPWKSAHAGHWITRNHLATRWRDDVGNVRVQCPACNLFRGGQPQIFAHRLMQEFGPEIIDKLISLSRETRKYSRADLQAMIEDYETRLRQMEQ